MKKEHYSGKELLKQRAVERQRKQGRRSKNWMQRQMKDANNVRESMEKRKNGQIERNYADRRNEQ